MKSSESSKFSVPRSMASILALAVLVASAVSIWALRRELGETYHRIRVQSDVYALPAPEQLIVVSLGYRAALADILYANTLVWYGLHFQEKRRFEFVGNYLDCVTTLDPSFRAPFLYADTLLIMQPVAARFEDYAKARALLERGMRSFPNDAEIWLNAGQFLAYLASPQLGDSKLKEQWRVDGARVLAKACEFVSSNENIPYHCITAAGLLSKAGERDATIRFLERVLAVTDDEEIRDRALRYLQGTFGKEQRELLERRHQRFHEAWAADLRFVTRDQLLLIGPRFDSARCAGRQATGSVGCTTSWRAWAEEMRNREAR